MEINRHYDDEVQALNAAASALEMLTKLFLQQL
jgi:hypothetical protein